MEDTIQVKEQKAILVGLQLTNHKKEDYIPDMDASMEELEELAIAGGAQVLGHMVQNREAVDVVTFIGKGKAEELKEYAEKMGANLLIFNHELSGVQQRNLEDVTELEIVDRTTLILDIFAQRASTKEGKLQVELAQLKYRLPRLTMLGRTYTRTGGGIGTRGPGEKKLETDRRHIHRTMDEIRREMKEMKKNRAVQRSQRIKSHLPVVALVGYTNAGKSTLTNELMKADRESGEDKELFVKDMLFATLDIALRKAVLPNQQPYLLIDTVGFVSRLPHDLVDAFKGTLEEILHADLLLHIIDASNEEYELQLQTTDRVLHELGVGEKSILHVLNKGDKIGYEFQGRIHGEKILISAKMGHNVEKLRLTMQQKIGNRRIPTVLQLPFHRGDIASLLHSKYSDVEEEYTEDGICVAVALDQEDYQRYDIWRKAYKEAGEIHGSV